MRKLLLATVAGLGTWGAVASDASAQNAVQAPTQSNASYTTYQGGAALPSASAPAPGTVVVRLNGRVRFYAYGAFDGDTNSTASAPAINATGTSAAVYAKQDKYGFAEYGRLYPGFDGVAANGLKYGASLETAASLPKMPGAPVFISVAFGVIWALTRPARSASAAPTSPPAST
jgi:hypothetical protein